MGRLQPLGVALGADIFNGNFQGEDVDDHCGVGVNDGHGVQRALDRCERGHTVRW